MPPICMTYLPECIMFKEYVHPTPPDWAGGACGCGGASLSVGVGEAAKLYIFSCNKKCGILNN